MKKGLIVRTKFGYGIVTGFRPEGEILIIHLNWGGELYTTASEINSFISKQEEQGIL